MTHDGDSHLCEVFDERYDLFSSFDLDSVHVAFLYQSDRGFDSVRERGVVGTERQVGDEEGSVTSSCDGSTVVQQFVEREGSRRRVPACDHGEGISDEANIDSTFRRGRG